jgi:hypothetical protein
MVKRTNELYNKKSMIGRRVTIITMLMGLVIIGLFVFSLAIFAYQPQAIAEKFNSSIFTNTKIASNNMAQAFHESYVMLINNSHLLTQSYQKEIGKWQTKQNNMIIRR